MTLHEAPRRHPGCQLIAESDLWNASPSLKAFWSFPALRLELHSSYLLDELQNFKYGFFKQR
jgi:hypothetical protein